jgi:uncharacterized membrane protein YedE/YeeE
MWSGPSDAYLVASIGLAGGVVLGLAARMGRFCTMGAIEDMLYGGSDHRMRMWLLAIATAMVATFALAAGGYVTLGETIYLRGGWNPLASIAGGLLFGYGMALCGNCAFGSLARLGGGDLRSFVIVLVLGIAAYVTINGPLGYLRVWLFPPDLIETAALPGYAHLLEGATGLPAPAFGIAAGLAGIAALLSSAGFRAERSMILWGAAVGVTVAAALAGTQWIADRSLGAVPVETYTFAAPIGETVLFAMTASGATVTFGIGAVAGVWLGAFLGSLLRGHFRWEACEDPRELRRQILGAGLMGAGAAIAMGCTIGQGVSAMALLAYGAPLALVSMIVGAALGLRQLIQGFAFSGEA